MAVETTASGTVVTGEHIDMFRFVTAMRAVAMDVWGIKPTRGFSSIKMAAEYGVKARTKRQALEGMIALMQEANPEWEPTGTIKKALDK